MDAPAPSRPRVASASTRALTPSFRPAEAATLAVEEFAGLDGPFVFAERLLQRIWAERSYDARQLHTTDGRPVVVRHAGRWNRLGGPDFIGARLLIGGREVEGDVELHLRASDWDAHGHAADPAYAGVVLHVVLLPAERRVTRGAGGRELPIVALLPALLHDLEEYAADDAVERLAGRSARRAVEELAALPPAELRAQLRDGARHRWRQKVGFARRRVERLGWIDACHHTALEILGYRANRAPMLNVASRWPLAEWTAGRVTVDAAFAGGGDAWIAHGVRPANQPRVRLAQYARWVAAVPDWPAVLARLTAPEPGAVETIRLTAASTDPAAAPSAAWRRAAKFGRWQAEAWRACTGCEVGGTRADNLWVDGFLPLLESQTTRPEQWWPTWWHARPGDLPELLPGALRTLGLADGRVQPICAGWAQGVLGWMIAREARLTGAEPT